MSGIERITAEELLQRHRDATISRGDLVRAIVVLSDRVKELEERLDDLMEANRLWSGR